MYNFIKGCSIWSISAICTFKKKIHLTSSLRMNSCLGRGYKFPSSLGNSGTGMNQFQPIWDEGFLLLQSMEGAKSVFYKTDPVQFYSKSFIKNKQEIALAMKEISGDFNFIFHILGIFSGSSQARSIIVNISLSESVGFFQGQN